MSSALLETSLEPDVRLRRLLLVSALIFLFGGVFLIFILPVGLSWRALITVIWVADLGREIAKMIAGMARVTRLMLDTTGRIVASNPQGEFQELTLLTGSMVSGRIAWLRLRFPDNSDYAELFCGDPAKNQQWQRLQLIWQQSSRAFGRQTEG